MRPIRKAAESITEKVPQGPLKFVGGGNASGAALFTIAEVLGFFTPGSSLDPGFKVQSHSVERSQGREIHTFFINAFFRDTARFASKFDAAPSNIDFLLRETHVRDIELVEERRTSSTWKVVVDVNDRNHA